MQTDVAPAGLPTRRQRELVHVRPQVADAVEVSRRGVRDECDPWVIEPLPGRDRRIEGQPGSAKRYVI